MFEKYKLQNVPHFVPLVTFMTSSLSYQLSKNKLYMDLDYLYEVRISVEEEILYHKEVTSTRFVDLLLRGNKLMNEAGVAFITEITID